MKQNDFKLINKNGIPMYEIPSFDCTGKVEAYFSTRLGGVSTGECGTMNLNLFKNADVDNSKKNIQLFCDAIKFDRNKIVANHEAHTDVVKIVDEKDIKDDLYDMSLYEDADGLITNSKNIFLYGYASDCALCYFFDPENEVIAMTHVGWLGSLNGIITNTIDKMKLNFNTKPQNIIAAIGPSIGICCFEVDTPVAQVFAKKDEEFKKYIKEPEEGSIKYHIDLWGINELIMTRNGIKKENISNAGVCTMCNDELMHSYRKGRGENGVLGAFIRLL